MTMISPERLLATVVVPAYNEDRELSGHLAELMRVLSRPDRSYEYEVIVVDDGSTDDTYEIARQAAADHANMRVIRHASNRGLGCAIRTGVEAANGSLLAVYDSDLSYRPQIIPDLLGELEARGADVALASPYMRGGCVRNVPWSRRLLSREANRFLSFATNGRYATITCMVRAYRTAFLRRLQTSEERMEINVELLFKAIKQGASIVEIPASLEWSARRADSHSRLSAGRTARQITRTLGYGIAHRPAVLLALPGILPGVLPIVVGVTILAHADLKTIAAVTLGTMIVQNASLALFAGQLTWFYKNVLRRV